MDKVRTSIFYFLLASLLVATFGCTAEKNKNADTTDNNQKKANAGSRELECQLSSVYMENGDSPEDSTRHFYCIPLVDGKKSDELFPITLPKPVLDEGGGRLDSGHALLAIPGGAIENGKVIIPNPQSVNLTIPLQFTKSLNYFGDNESIEKTLLAVRVSTRDASPGFSLDKLRSRMFTPGDRNLSGVSQFESCSAGQLKIVPTEELGQGGVIEVSLDIDLADDEYETNPWELQRLAKNQLLTKIDLKENEIIRDRFDHVVFCLPDHPDQKWEWIASAETNGKYSIYRGDNCLYPSNIMHELGHNLGLGHSNENGKPYYDQTSYMGFGESNEEGPQKCFNSANNYQLGWFAEKTLVHNVSDSPRRVHLAGTVDHKKTNNQKHYSSIKIGPSFISYNRAKGFNHETKNFHDEVLLHQQMENSTDLKGTISPNSKEYVVNGTSIFLCDSIIGNDQLPDVMIISLGGTCEATANIDEPISSPETSVTEQLTYRSGLSLEMYFNLPSDTTRLPDFSSLEVDINFVAKEISVGKAAVDFFAFRYTGFLRIDTPGEYEFSLTSDDGSHLIIDGQSLLKNDGIRDITNAKASKYLDSGYVPLELQYLEVKNDQFMKLEYRLKNQGNWMELNEAIYHISP